MKFLLTALVSAAFISSVNSGVIVTGGHPKGKCTKYLRDGVCT